MPLAEAVQSFLSAVYILPRRLSLVTPGIQATVPMLRGVWGAALHDLDAEAYRMVFVGGGPLHERVPPFVFRPAPPSPEDNPALDWILIGEGIRYEKVLLRAWDIASGMGLGPQRRRFHIRASRILDPAGHPQSTAFESSGWSLRNSSWPLSGPAESTSCRLCFPAPLRLIREHRLIEHPSLVDIVVAGARRLVAFLPSPAAEKFREMQPGILEQARAVRTAPWVGQRLDLVRYSGRQKRELEMRGVTGYLDLPDGPGQLWPLLAASQWLHIGKGTVAGMGQVMIEASE